MSPEPRTVIIADDHPIVREGLRAVLATMPDFTLATAAATGREAVAAAAAAPADVVIMDLYMPDLDGVTATRQILAANPKTAVLILTMYADDAMLTDALRAGSRGYLLKGAAQADIARAIRAVAAGELVFGSEVADAVIARLTGTTHLPGGPLPELTGRELEVLDALAQGVGTAAVAARLYLSPKTVRNHVANMLAKLDLPDRSQLIARAREAGLGQTEPSTSHDRAQLDKNQ